MVPETMPASVIKTCSNLNHQINLNYSSLFPSTKPGGQIRLQQLLASTSKATLQPATQIHQSQNVAHSAALSLPRHTSRFQLTKPWLSCCTPNLTEQHHLKSRPTSRLPQHPQHLHRSRRDRGRASALENRHQATSLHLEKGGRWTRQLLVYFITHLLFKKFQHHQYPYHTLTSTTQTPRPTWRPSPSPSSSKSS